MQKPLFFSRISRENALNACAEVSSGLRGGLGGSPGGSFWITLPLYLLSGSFWGPFALLGLHFDCLLVPLGPSRGVSQGVSPGGPFGVHLRSLGSFGLHFGPLGSLLDFWVPFLALTLWVRRVRRPFGCLFGSTLRSLGPLGSLWAPFGVPLGSLLA